MPQDVDPARSAPPNQRDSGGDESTLLESRDRRADSSPEDTRLPGAFRAAPRPQAADVDPTTHLPLGVPARLVDRGQIGRGGMGEVRSVFDRSLLREVAMKRVLSTAPEWARQCFIEEAQITGQLDHPNIVPVHELGLAADGQPYYTMKQVHGTTLSDELLALQSGERASDDLERILRILLKVCDAIAFAHERGVIHRDLKPSNVMIGSHGQVYVMDWGVALLRAHATRRPEARPSSAHAGDGAIRTSGNSVEIGVVGTLGYMSPEQAAGVEGSVDARSDVFALGAILYQVLTGRPAHVGRTPTEALDLARIGKVAPPEEVAAARALPPRLCEIAMKALATLPDDRHQSVDDLRADIEDFLKGGGWFATRSFRRGEVIVAEGEPADAGYIVAKGTCDVYQQRDGKRVILRRLGPGDVFGETAIAGARVRTATVEALDDVTVRVVTQEALARELGQGSWAGALISQLAARFFELEQQVRGPRDGASRRT
jgi:serine/threonine-protein kinase